MIVVTTLPLIATAAVDQPQQAIDTFKVAKEVRRDTVRCRS